MTGSGRWTSCGAAVLGLPAAAVAAALVLVPTGSPWWTGILAVGAPGWWSGTGDPVRCTDSAGSPGDVLDGAVEVNLLVLVVVASA
ncbi:MAG TPA: hypothetical protein VIU11_05080 [Nakamurella sp.]